MLSAAGQPPPWPGYVVSAPPTVFQQLHVCAHFCNLLDIDHNKALDLRVLLLIEPAVCERHVVYVLRSSLLLLNVLLAREKSGNPYTVLPRLGRYCTVNGGVEAISYSVTQRFALCSVRDHAAVGQTR